MRLLSAAYAAPERRIAYSLTGQVQSIYSKTMLFDEPRIVELGRKNTPKLVQSIMMDGVPAIILELTKGYFTIVDEADWDVVNKYSWSYQIPGGYPAAQVNYKKIKLHQYLTEYPMTDHVNGNKLDNRRCNLRECTKSQNSINSGSRGGASRFRGVSLARGRWRARLKHDGKYLSLGQFSTEEEAAEAYNQGALEYHGEFARLNQIQP